MIGGIGYYIPVFTAERYETLTSFYGLRGEQNRKKLAKIFKTPTNWYDYCNFVDKDNNCTVPDSDNISQRYPLSKEERESYYIEGLYNGHFRVTDDNDCDKNPHNCTGSIVGPPCSWTTYLDNQIYWNNINMTLRGPIKENNGYSYDHMTQIWKAANATQSDVFFWWWTPDLVSEEFAGSSAEFQRVTFPTTTEECVRYRSENLNSVRCSDSPFERRGEEIGKCDYAVIPLKMVMSRGLSALSSSATEAARSPAYAFLKQLYIPEYALPKIFRHWTSLKNSGVVDPPREALCEWVYDNLDELLRYSPPGYPRDLKTNAYTDFTYTVYALGSVSLIAALASAYFVYKLRDHRVIKMAKVNLLSCMISGKTQVLV